MNGILAAAISATDDLLGKSASYFSKPEQPAPADPAQTVHERSRPNNNSKSDFSHAEASTNPVHSSNQQQQPQPHAENLSGYLPSVLHTATTATPPAVQDGSPQGGSEPQPGSDSDHGAMSCRSAEPTFCADDDQNFESRELQAQDNPTLGDVAVANDTEQAQKTLQTTLNYAAAGNQSPHQSSVQQSPPQSPPPTAPGTMTFTAQQVDRDGQRDLAASAITRNRSQLQQTLRLQPRARRAHSAQRHQQQEVGGKRSRHPDDESLQMQPGIFLPRDLLPPIRHAWMNTGSFSPHVPSTVDQISAQHKSSGSDQHEARGAVMEGIDRCVSECLSPPLCQVEYCTCLSQQGMHTAATFSGVYVFLFNLVPSQVCTLFSSCAVQRVLSC